MKDMPSITLRILNYRPNDLDVPWLSTRVSNEVCNKAQQKRHTIYNDKIRHLNIQEPSTHEVFRNPENKLHLTKREL